MSSLRKTKNKNPDDDDVKEVEFITTIDDDDKNNDPSSSSLLLQLAMKTAGSDGIVKLGAVEVYKYGEEYGDLKLVDMWISDITKERAGFESSVVASASASASASAEEDNHTTSLSPSSQVVPIVRPGTGLVGTLWSSTRTKMKMSSSKQQRNNLDILEENTQVVTATTTSGYSNSSNRKIFSSLRRLNDRKQQQRQSTNTNLLFWRDLTTIEIDPDTWNCSRLSKQIQSQLSQAAGLPFDIDGIKGFVVYYTHKDTKGTLLKSIHNTTYLKRCTTHIGSVVAILESHRTCMEYKKQLRKSLTTSSPSYINDDHEQQKQNNNSIDEDDEEVAAVASSSPTSAATATAARSQPSLIEKVPTDTDIVSSSSALSKRTTTYCGRRVVGWYNKCWGAGLQIPPPMEIQQVSWTLLGSFIGMLVLSLLSEMFVSLTDEEYFLVIGPFGAQMTLLYALHAAPASQPRNVVLGEVIAGAVSMSVAYLPMPKWLRRAVCPALGISAMTAAGVIHPPAGAHATIWADRNHNWNFYFIVVFCSAVSVIPATLVNNMSLKRQYPIYWGYLPKWLYRRIWKDEDENE